MPKAPAIGIDLGTTQACVAVFRHGQVEIIPNDQGQRTTPSYVTFTDTQRLVGDAAKNQAFRNPRNTVFDTKRLIGRRFSDNSVQHDMKHWPFKVIDDGDKPKVQVKYKGETMTLAPEEVSSMVLVKMKETAEAYLGQTVTDAVITVPANFNDSQRQATKDAGTIAGLNVLRIINEPTAAAIAYGVDWHTGERNVLVFDLGGGTFDALIVNIEDSSFHVKATAGDTHLGGEDFDGRLMSHFIQEFRRKYKKDISDNPRATRRLRTACERAKCTLSSAIEASVEIDSLYDGLDFYTRIKRVRFEELCADLFRGTLEPVEKALRDAKMDKQQIHEVVLVGGSTRIPQIQKLLQDFMNGKELNKSIHPNEAVAYGAAVQAAVLHGDKSKEICNVLLVDVAPLSLGIETSGGVMTKLVERNTGVPVTKSQIFTTDSSEAPQWQGIMPVNYFMNALAVHTPRVHTPRVPTNDRKIIRPCPNNPSAVTIQVYEGERAMTRDNNLLGSFELTCIPQAYSIEVTFDIDVNGILEVTALDKSTGKSSNICVTNKSRMSKADMDRMMRDAERYREEDDKQRQRVESRNKLEDYVFSVQQAVKDGGDKLNAEDRDGVLTLCKDAHNWLASDSQLEKEEMDDRLQELQTRCSPIMGTLQGLGQGHSAESSPHQPGYGPTIEEVD